MFRYADGRGGVKVSPTTVAILEGSEDLSVWDDEELLRGQRRAKNGNFSGSRPKVVPLELHHELNRRRMSRAGEVLRESVLDAVELWRSVLLDNDAPLAMRMRASELVVERVMGKAKETVDVKFESEPPWAVAIREMYRTQGPLQVGPGDVIDAEVVEDDDDSWLT